MIKTNLIVSVDEPFAGGDKNVFNVRTTETSQVIIEVSSVKLFLDPKDIEEALAEIKSFLNVRGVTEPVLETKIDPAEIQHNVEYGDDVS